MKLKIDIKSFENFVKKYDQLLNLHEVPNQLKGEFLNDARNVLLQCYRIIEGYERSVSRKKLIDAERRGRRFEEQRNTRSNKKNSKR